MPPPAPAPPEGESLPLDDDAEDTLTGVSEELLGLVERVEAIDDPLTEPGVDLDDADTGVD